MATFILAAVAGQVIVKAHKDSTWNMAFRISVSAVFRLGQRAAAVQGQASRKGTPAIARHPQPGTLPDG